MKRARIITMVVVAAALALAVPVQANAATLSTRVRRLESKVKTVYYSSTSSRGQVWQNNQISAIKTQIAAMNGKLNSQQAQIDALSAELALANQTISAQDTQIDGLTNQLASAEATIAVLEDSSVMDLEPYVTVIDSPIFGLTGPNILFEGANVHLRSGSGSTDGPVNGLGNLIIGYNEVYTTPETQRTGSHNLVMGNAQRFTSYGGLLAGSWNHSTAPGTFLAGSANTASGLSSSVSGGSGNTASGENASVSGGSTNTASAYWSSVGGGYSNLASGGGASVSGGNGRTAGGIDDWAAGGLWQEN